MKNINLILTVSIVALFGWSALAHQMAPNTVAEKIITGGFINVPAHGVRIESDGKIIAFQGARTEFIGKLRSTGMTGLAVEIENISENLKDHDSDKPYCVDHPNSEYLVMKKDRKQVTAAQATNCHLVMVEGGEKILRLLDALDELSKATIPSMQK